MNDRQRALVDDVLDFWKDQIGTHSADCWKYHAQCLAVALDNLEQLDLDDVTSPGTWESAGGNPHPEYPIVARFSFLRATDD